MVKIMKILFLVLGVISPLCFAQDDQEAAYFEDLNLALEKNSDETPLAEVNVAPEIKSDETPLPEVNNFVEDMSDETSLGEINGGGYKCTFKEGGGMFKRRMGLFKQDECFQKCVDLRKSESQINGVAVFTDQKKKGCWCLEKMPNRNKNKKFKSCVLGGESSTGETVAINTNVIKSGAVSCEFKEGGAKNPQWMGHYKQDICLEKCLELKVEESQINGIEVWSDQDKTGCWCLQTMPNRNNNKNKKSCVLVGPGMTVEKGPDIIKSGEVTCEFKEGGSKNARWMGDFKQDKCLVECLELKKQESHINGVAVWKDQTNTGCWCLQDMPNRNNNKRLKSCTIQGAGSTGEEGSVGAGLGVFQSGGLVCQFQLGGGSKRIRVRVDGTRQDQCVQACLNLQKERSEVNGAQVFKDQNKAGCWCLNGNKVRNQITKFKSCFFEGSTRRDFSNIDPYRYNVRDTYDTYDMRDMYNMYKAKKMHDMYERRKMMDEMDERRNMMRDMYKRKMMRDMYKRKMMRDAYIRNKMDEMDDENVM